MKIAFIARSTLFKQPGGDTQQVVETASELNRLNIEVDILLSSSKIDVEPYDLLHFFNLGRPADLLRVPNWESKPLFVSTIWVDYGRSHFAEYAKSIARGCIGNDLLPPFSYLKAGHSKSIETIVENADVLVTTTNREVDTLNTAFGTELPTYVIHPGINRDFTEPLPPEKEERSGILCVGRFEELKNQLAVIQATADWDIPVTFVGSPASNNPSYYNKCKRAAGSNHSFRPHSSLEALKLLYRSHKVVVVPSTFETFGLTALESLSQGCNLVLSEKAGAVEVLKDCAFTFDPNDISALKTSLEGALESPTKAENTAIARTFTWQKAAEQLKKLYEARLSS